MSRHAAPATVPVIPGRDLRSVTDEDQTCPIPRAGTPNRLQRVISAAKIRDSWTRMKSGGLAPVMLMGFCCLLVDAAVYAAYAWPFW